MLSTRQRNNLAKLATYLEQLPADYEHFDMTSYVDHKGDCDIFEDKTLERAFVQNPKATIHNCGTVACAAGHGPAAGIPLRRDERVLTLDWWDGTPTAEIDWAAYIKRAFGVSQGDDWTWMFGGDWADVDNTPQGAAKRIRYFLEHGVPEDFYYHCQYSQFQELYADA
jgi:hypothetical protein